MLVERSGIVLRKHKHPVNAAVDAIADGNVYQSVFTCDRHGGLAPGGG
jgi:hypothetical protein